MVVETLLDRDIWYLTSLGLSPPYKSEMETYERHGLIAYNAKGEPTLTPAGWQLVLRYALIRLPDAKCDDDD